MGIFEFSRPENYSIISEEWQIFESVFPDTGASVSYTHLDVYKRQLLVLYLPIMTGL